jgi:CrcB protein
MTALFIALGGAVGTLGRYGVTIALGKWLGAAFPFGTLCVNVLGSFLLGVIAEALGGATVFGADLRLVLGVGVMGGFTTYSSFNLEALRLFEQGQAGKALGYMLVTLIACLAFGALGVAAARIIPGTSAS